MVVMNCFLFLCTGRAHFSVTMEAPMLDGTTFLASDRWVRERVAGLVMADQISPDRLKRKLGYLVLL